MLNLCSYTYVFLGCKGTADLLYTGTMALGCNTFIESQQKACSCGSGQGRKKPDRDEF